jgi:hypothetical protein
MNFYEKLQAEIIRAAFKSSVEFGNNYWDDIVGFLAYSIDRKILFD